MRPALPAQHLLSGASELGLCHPPCRYLFPNLPGLLQKPLQLASQVVTKTPIKGAQTSLYLALSSEVEGVSGKYYADLKPKTTSEESYDQEVCMSPMWFFGMDLTHRRRQSHRRHLQCLSPMHLAIVIAELSCLNKHGGTVL